MTVNERLNEVVRHCQEGNTYAFCRIIVHMNVISQHIDEQDKKIKKLESQITTDRSIKKWDRERENIPQAYGGKGVDRC